MGNIVEIETRGSRNCNDIFFKVKDVSVGFEMDRLQNTLVDDRWGYENNKDYKYFMCKKNKNKITKEVFLTYEGILRVLFVSKSGKTKQFIKWATETLFTVQMGTKQQKKTIS